jgi:hypothetical protein
MKKLLFIGLILAICILAMPQGVMAAQTNTADPVIVNAEYLAAPLGFTAGLATEGFVWDLIKADEGGANLRSGEDAPLTFTVNSAGTWTVTVTDSDLYADSDGYLYSPTAMVHTLANSFKIANDGDTGMIDIIGGDVTIQTGSPEDTAFNKAIDQAVVQADYAADDYSITLTFTCTNDWNAP